MTEEGERSRILEVDPRAKFDFRIDRLNCGIDPGDFSSFISNII